MNTALILNTPQRSSLRLTLPVLVLAALGLAYTGWQSWIKPLSGYGDDQAAMAEIKQADPRVLAGGDLTTFHQGFKPFEQEAPNLPWQWSAQFGRGDGLIEARFSPAMPSGERPDRDGVGPHFNANSCAACHVNDGRAAPPLNPEKDGMLGMFLRLSVADGKGGWAIPKGMSSHQLHDRAVPGVPVEGLGRVAYQTVAGQYADGTPFELLQPRYWVESHGYKGLGAYTLQDYRIEARVAPPMHGMGLIEAIDEKTLLALAAARPDGVSGRPNYVVNPETGKTEMGRFSWKANVISPRLQSAGAFFNDMGITSPVFPRDGCGAGQVACSKALSGGTVKEPEISEAMLQDMTFYLQLLAVPARRDVEKADVRAGEALFAKAQCVACHTPQITTGNSHPLRRLRNQTIQPFSDFLLHDMGPGLAGRPDGEASEQEWRTPPLWGIGLTHKSNGHTRFLHDGRARNLEEAILWHGGEADKARARFITMSKTEREQLLAFLNSL